MRIRPTELGWKGLLLLLALEVAFLASNYSNLFFLLITFGCVLGVLGAVWSYTHLRRLEVSHVRLPMAAAGDAREIQLELKSKHPAHGISVALVLTNQVVPVIECASVSGAMPVCATLPGFTRGHRELAAVRLTSCFPFGLFACRIDRKVAAELVTYPRPLPAGDRALAVDRREGDALGRSGGRSSAVAGLRPFRPGDAVGDVDWKATARRGTAVVREHEREAEHRLQFVLDRRCDAATLEHELMRIAAAVFAARRDEGMTLHTQGAVLTVRQDRASEEAALRWLASATVLPATAAAPPQVPGALRLPGQRPDGGGHG